MNEQNQRDSIMSMARGAFEERVDYEMDKVIQNILDPNTKATAKRKITLTIELTPDDERRTMPLRDNVPEPPTDDWQLTTCPVCGAECWQTDTARRILTLEPDVRTACTACALKGLGK